ncbi:MULTISPECIES: DEAD/DEAH box helicase [unclassified Crossiella]|uniref:DEAD/DEAH box helicase n=1 Tax=unclassified Crossiella TaxID=2620835 RepID=UPI001FFFCC18|nr:MULTISPECIES: AAA domain-containing protein [unclassified Crossiella]MCK2239568.1 AAA domain-containing protein [Crossiella sp. S99.2]MCK2252263.1 AAA domain-containing protein [Crossiella sp. S99.1]
MTALERVHLPRAIVLLFSHKVQTTVEQDRMSRPGLPQLMEVQADLRARSGDLGVPARLELSGNPRLTLYGANYAISLYPRTGYYQVGHIGRLTGRDHRNVARGALLLHAPDWRFHSDRRQAQADDSDTHWEALNAAWTRLPHLLDQADQAERRTVGDEQHYLSTVDKLVEASRTVEIAKARQGEPMLYRAVRTTTEERHSAKGVYEFNLLRPCPVQVGEQVRIQDRDQLRGRIFRVDGLWLTLRFDGVVDFRLIPQTGRLEVAPVENTYFTQKRALAALRDGKTANPDLLPLLVDHRFTPYQPDPRPVPGIRLDDAQREAFSRACSVPDLLLIQGPPGTGKTRTIAEIAAACAARGERVLLTSFTNKAVDNALAALPGQLRSVRVGDEDKLSTFARGRTVDAQADTLQTSMIERIDRDSGRLLAIGEQVPGLQSWLRQAGEQVSLAEVAAREVDRLSGWAQRHADQLRAPLLGQQRELDHRATAQAQILNELRPLLAEATARRDRAAERLAHSLFRPWRRWQLARRERRLDVAGQQEREAAQQLALTQAELARLHARLADVGAADPVACQIAAELATATARFTSFLTEADSGLARLRQATAGLSQPPQVSWADLSSWQRHLAWWERELPLLGTRSRLLNEWRAELHEPAGRLHTELVRYADVVAATCLGLNASLLQELEIDVAIVDEAGQISLPTVLVPLVRARRAVLVGDHQQLPPLVEPELRKLLSDPADGDRLDPHSLRTVLASAFESLFDTTPAENRIMLREQRRMPESIAEFVSTQFYDGRLSSAVRRVHHDPLFSHPFAIVDTSDQPEPERAETDLSRGKGSTMAGYLNHLEARIITRLIAHAARRGEEWAVIVPYNGQVQLIRDSLVAELGSQRAVRDHVGTVDSFQGGERDLVVYGCTRSNPDGAVGFLRELRRFNVAITRAKEQLVVVGDLIGLLQAKDEEFRQLMIRMAEHVHRHGQILPSAELLRMLEQDGHDEQ